MRLETLLSLARLQIDAGNCQAAWNTIRRAFIGVWRYPQLWWVVHKRMIRLVVRCLFR
jgi:hypothetical protein